MGLTRQYLRYAPTNVFGIVAGSRSNLKMIKYKGGVTGKYAAVGACEFVFIWDLKKAEIVVKLVGDAKSEVTCIEQDPAHWNKLAVGYADGSFRVFDLKHKVASSSGGGGGDQFSTQSRLQYQSLASYLTFNGHKSSITSISFDSTGLRVVTGAKDTDLVVWDLLGECGLFRLKGHKAPIAKAIFMTAKNVVISSSKDMLVKFWDLDIQHCFKTIVSHRSEVNDLMLVSDDRRLITGCHDVELKVFALTFKSDNEADEEGLVNGDGQQTEPDMKKLRINDENGDNNNNEDEGDEASSSSSSLASIVECKLLGTLVRESKDALTQLCMDATRTVFTCHSANEKHVELYKINTRDEIKKKLAKKLKKQKRKSTATATTDDNNDNDEEDTTTAAAAAAAATLAIQQTVADEFTRICLLSTKHKIKWVDVSCELAVATTTRVTSRDGDDDADDDERKTTKSAPLLDCKVACLLVNNQLEVYAVHVDKQLHDLQAPQIVYALHMAGHRTDVRTIAFSSDSTAFCTASGDCMKVWNRMSLNCIRTFACDYALACLFLSDDNHVIIGTKSGKLQLFNINMASMLENVMAHEDDTSVWSLSLLPDKSGFVSGGADKTVRFWTFELVDDEQVKTRKRLTFNNSRTFKLDDDVLSVKISPNGRLLAVALLDTTVKVFFVDTLKLFLNLYGHKQPVLCMDISFDNRLIVTGSADRHVKIWGMDFGDCHRSLYAHEESIMAVQFVAKTHYFFSVGKDGKLKEWDADKFERIITLDGHLSEIWSLAVSGDGRFVLTSSHDKSLRIWEKTDEPLVLEDERESEKEQQYENEIPKEEQVIAGETSKETGLATIKTIETLKSAEKVIEALNIYREEQNKLDMYNQALSVLSTKEEKEKIKMDPKHPLLIALGDMSAEDYVLDTLRKTKAAEIETTLLVLEFEHVKMLLELLAYYLQRNKEIELCLKCTMFLLKINYGQITTTQTLLLLVEKLKALCFERISALKDSVGFNLAGCQFIKQQLEENEEVRLFADLTSKHREKNKKKQNKITLLNFKSASSLV